MWASVNRYLVIVRTLVEYGAAVEAKSNVMMMMMNEDDDDR
jgi:hypothetical protein